MPQRLVCLVLVLKVLNSRVVLVRRCVRLGRRRGGRVSLFNYNFGVILVDFIVLRHKVETKLDEAVKNIFF